MFRGTDNTPQNIPKYFPHSECYGSEILNNVMSPLDSQDMRVYMDATNAK